jgi:hypothetical protein
MREFVGLRPVHLDGEEGVHAALLQKLRQGAGEKPKQSGSQQTRWRTPNFSSK